MRHPDLFAVLFVLSGSVLPVAALAQQPDAKPNDNQTQSAPVQPDRSPQQSEQSRQQDNRAADETRLNRDWTTRQGGDERTDMDRMRQRRADQEKDSRTVGRNWRLDNDEPDRRSSYGSMDRGEGRYQQTRPYRRVKTCVEYDNGDEFCRYLD